MASEEDITPRALIQVPVEGSSVSRSTGQASRGRQRRSNTTSRINQLKKGEKKRPRSISDLTPRTLIQGLLQNTDVEHQSPAKRGRPNPPDVRTTSSTSSVQQSSARRQATRVDNVAFPEADMTPRTLISGLMQVAPVETPAVHVRQSTPNQLVDFPQVEETIQRSSNSTTLSPYMGETTAMTTKQSQRSTLRKRQPISSEDFAAGVHEKISQRQEGERDERSELAGEGRGDESERNMAGFSEEEEEEEEEDEEMQDEYAVEGTVTDGDASGAPAGISVEAGEVAEEAGDLSDEAGDMAEDGEDAAGNAGDLSVEAGEEAEEDGDVPNDRDGVSVEASDLSHKASDSDQMPEDIQAENGQPDSVINTSPTPSAPLSDQSTRSSANKQAADSTWMGRESQASIPSQREGSPSLMRRVPDSTVGDSASDGDVVTSDDQPMDSEVSLGGSGEEQQTASMAQSRMGDFSPLVTPKLPAGAGRPTPLLKKTPAPARQQAANRPKASASAVQKPAPARKPPVPKKDGPCLPSSLTKSILTHFSKARLSKEALAAAEKGAEAFFRRLSNDLTAYSHHARRQTIEQADVELLMRRQGLAQDQQSLYALIEKYLPLEYRKELIPMATAGNKVTPKPNR